MEFCLGGIPAGADWLALSTGEIGITRYLKSRLAACGGLTSPPHQPVVRWVYLVFKWQLSVKPPIALIRLGVWGEQSCLKSEVNDSADPQVVL